MPQSHPPARRIHGELGKVIQGNGDQPPTSADVRRAAASLEAASAALAAATTALDAQNATTRMPAPPATAAGRGWNNNYGDSGQFRLVSAARQPAPPRAAVTPPAAARRVPAPAAAKTGPPKPPRHGWKSDAARWAFAGLGSVVIGIIVTVTGAHQEVGYYPHPDTGLIGLGVTMIAMPFLFVIIAGLAWIGRGIAEDARNARAKHAAWLAQFPPGEQAQIRAAEKAALWAGMAAGAVAWHEHNKDSAARTAALVANSPSHKYTEQVIREQAAQRQHQELLSAIQGQQSGGTDPMTAATQRMIAQSAANRAYAARPAQHHKNW